MSASGGLIPALLVFNPPEFGWLGSLVVALCMAATLLAYTLGPHWRHGHGTRFGVLALRSAALICLFLTLMHPACVSELQTTEAPLIAVLLDDSASMAQPAGGTDTRYTHATTLLRGELLPALAASHRIHLFDAEARSLTMDDLPAQPLGKRTPLTEALLRIQHDLADDTLTGIVLLSDGAEVFDGPVIGELEQVNVPVHTVEIVGPGVDAAGRDLAIQAVATNQRALVGNTVHVAVDLSARGITDNTSAAVTILDGTRPVAAQQVTWNMADHTPATGARQQRVELEFIPHRPGQFTYTVRLDELPGEPDLTNNRETFPLSVRARPLTVLYVDGVLRWEGKFVREALAADPDINVVSAVRTARVGSDHRSQGLLLPEQLDNVDVVILGDVEGTYFSTTDELHALCAWVTDNGGGLLLTGGYHSFGPLGFGRTELRDILPVEFSALVNPQIEQQFNLRLTDAGREHPLFRLSGDRSRDTAFFHKLPPLSGCSRISGVKPGAEVLAVNSQVSGPDGRRSLPIMIAQQVGAGRTMVFAVDTTWRWRLVVGGFTGDSSFYERFWGQLVRWLASEQEQATQHLFVSTDRAQCSIGQAVTLEISLRDDPDSAESAKNLTVAATAIDETGQQLPVPLAELGDGQFRGTVAPRRPGRLDLLVAAESFDESAVALAESRIVSVSVQRPDLELLDPRPDPQWLARVAQLSGGRCIAPDQIQNWARELPAEPVTRTIEESTGLWGDRIFGTAFVVLLCLEWILRRRSQLA
ncbi:MAG: glutamine amidotransferase [Planctomycetota bacterium]